jgi:hypothetical protein
MSVLIKGMEMPTHCTECDFWHDGVFEHCLLNMEIQNEDVPLDEGEYPTACPLVPVPPHGRLIDANKIGLTDFEIILCQKGSPFKNALEILLEKIKDAPTIIEAEEGVKDITSGCGECDWCRLDDMGVCRYGEEEE